MIDGIPEDVYLIIKFRGDTAITKVLDLYSNDGLTD